MASSRLSGVGSDAAVNSSKNILEPLQELKLLFKPQLKKSLAKKLEPLQKSGLKVEIGSPGP
jgi:hypothetical protein